MSRKTWYFQGKMQLMSQRYRSWLDGGLTMDQYLARADWAHNGKRPGDFVLSRRQTRSMSRCPREEGVEALEAASSKRKITQNDNSDDDHKKPNGTEKEKGTKRMRHMPRPNGTGRSHDIRLMQSMPRLSGIERRNGIRLMKLMPRRSETKQGNGTTRMKSMPRLSGIERRTGTIRMKSMPRLSGIERRTGTIRMKSMPRLSGIERRTSIRLMKSKEN
ncbi:hypothetical protein Bbelb_287850 [Branchiostoma belcheri]|nr:hypothetical protein Bbelb_287850 [Branchiostoma belcheri]